MLFIAMQFGENDDKKELIPIKASILIVHYFMIPNEKSDCPLMW